MNEFIPDQEIKVAQCEMEPYGPLAKLKQKKERLEKQLASVNNAVEALEKQPELAKVMELVAKAM